MRARRICLWVIVFVIAIFNLVVYVVHDSLQTAALLAQKRRRKTKVHVIRSRLDVARKPLPTPIQPIPTPTFHNYVLDNPSELFRLLKRSRKSTAGQKARLFPNRLSTDDRIVDQFLFKPVKNHPAKKLILLSTNNDHKLKAALGKRSIDLSACPVNSCVVTFNQTVVEAADLIMYRASDVAEFYQRLEEDRDRDRSKQITLLWFDVKPQDDFASPVNASSSFNWTASYRPDSDIVVPYGKWMPIGAVHTGKPINYTRGKTKPVAWLVERCNESLQGLQYAYELNKYIQVDIYGDCGSLSCSTANDECFNLLESDYKFYLAFERGRCRDLITDQFFRNALLHNILPIVMGPPEDDYIRLAPPHSFIHVDQFDSAQELANYLLLLNQDDDDYNTYFQWHYTGSLIDTQFLCRVCGMLRYAEQLQRPRWHDDVWSWWNQTGIH